MNKKKIFIIIPIIAVIVIVYSIHVAKYTPDEGSKLTSKDLHILHKDYSNLDKDEKLDYLSIRNKMNGKEFIKYKDELKKLYIDEHADIFKSKEKSEKMFKNTFDYELREKQGKLTAKEKEEDKQREKNAEEDLKKYSEYDNAKEKIKKLLETNVKYGFKNCAVIVKLKECDPVNDNVTIDMSVLTGENMYKGNVYMFRNRIRDTVNSIIKPETITTTIEIHGREVGEYIYYNDKNKWDNDDVEFTDKNNKIKD